MLDVTSWHPTVSDSSRTSLPVLQNRFEAKSNSTGSLSRTLHPCLQAGIAQGRLHKEVATGGESCDRVDSSSTYRSSLCDLTERPKVSNVAEGSTTDKAR